MASKRRLRRNACTGKVQYKTQKEAADVIFTLHRKGVLHSWVVPYHCPFCKQYHYGHPPRHVRNAIIKEGRSRF